MDLVKKFIQQAEEKGFYILSAQIRKNGEIVDDWTRFAAKPRFETYSIAKTFAGIGVGIALEEGLITLDEKISNTFREESFDVSNENALNIRVRDLLTMTAGLSETMMWRDGYERKHVKDWVRFFYTHGKFDNKPGTTFLYNNACPYMLGALIQERTGQNLREYLRYALLEFNRIRPFFIDASVDTHDISDRLSDQEIREKIRDDYLRDSSVTIVLVGRETKKRKHIDWEIYSSMYDGKVNKKSGIVVINLPSVNCSYYTAPHAGEKERLYPENTKWTTIKSRSEYESRYPYMPDRIIDNLLQESARISVVNWDKISSDIGKLEFLIDAAFNDRQKCVYDLSRPMRRANSLGNDLYHI